MKLSRRSFLKTTAAATTVAAFSARSWAQVAGANSDIRVAIVGLNGKGRDHFEAYCGLPGVRVVALCDVDSAVLDRALATAKALEGSDKAKNANPTGYADLRELLKRSDIDVISIASPNHQHAVQAIWAMQAGKDVYLEKPVCHNIWEGQQTIAAAKKYNRIVQAGTQSRSSPAIAESIAWMKAGNIGKLNAVYGLCYKSRNSIGKTSGPQAVPQTVNYDLWTGPAPLVPLHRRAFHYDWHWQWATGNGDIGNQGNHQMDVARRFIGESAFPRHVFSVGGRFGYLDDGETPNTLTTVFDYATAPLIFEVRGLRTRSGGPGGGGGRAGGGRGGRGRGAGAPGDAAAATPAPAAPAPAALPPIPPAAPGSLEERFRELGVGNVAICEGGYISVSANYGSAQAFDKSGKLLKEFSGMESNYGNFIDVVRSRKEANLNAPINEGRISSSICHLANISYRTGRAMQPGEAAEQVKGNAVLAEAFGRMNEHLAANSVNYTETPEICGAPLTIDPKTEKFTGANAAAASAHLSREYRQPFAVPQIS